MKATVLSSRPLGAFRSISVQARAALMSSIFELDQSSVELLALVL
jgi:hypothetical protein